MSNKAPIRLLILDDSQNRAEELIVLLRNSGRATRAQQIESHENLQTLLKAQSWDLFLSQPEANDVTAEQAIALIKEFERDIPFILIAEDNEIESITNGLRMGANDVALVDDEERLNLIINRELENLESRRLKRKAEVELKEIERRCQLLLESSKATISYIHDGMHIFANAVYCELFGFDDFDDLEVVPMIDLITSEGQASFKKFLKSFDDHEGGAAEYKCAHSDGSSFDAQLNLSRAQYDGEPCTQVIIRPLVDNQDLEDRLHELSNQDPTTNLPNRRRFIEMLDQVIEQAVKGNESSIICYIELDDFSDIVTQAGIADGDLILADIANFIDSMLDESQLLFRFSDDVFTLIYPNGNREEAEECADNIRKQVESHLCEVNGKTYQLTTSIGMALVTESTSNSEEIISRSREALTDSPDGNCVVFYQPKKAVEATREKSADSEIRDIVLSAFDKGRLKLLFQPIISLHGDDDEQFEVLIRLIDNEGNELGPGKFLDIFDEENLSIKLDRWIILQSTKLLAAHRSEGSQTRLFINIMHQTIADDTFLPWVSVALKAARLPTDAVIFQFHESDAITYMKQASHFTKGLKEIHCKASINHFGCSLNPFNSLKHLAIDYAKLDGSYAQDIDSNEEKREELIDTIKTLQSKGILTAISGVESPMVLSTLWEAGVNFIQGHYLSEPLENMDYDFSDEDM